MSSRDDEHTFDSLYDPERAKQYAEEPAAQPRIIRWRCPSGHRSSGRTDKRGVYMATVVCPQCGATAVREFG